VNGDKFEIVALTSTAFVPAGSDCTGVLFS
jgi:hypothetical protein